MLNEAYEAGQMEALEELEKFAGEEFVEKVAGVKDIAGKAGQKLRRAASYFSGKNIKRDFDISKARTRKWKQVGKDDIVDKLPIFSKERGKAMGRLALRTSPYTAGTAAAGYAGYEAGKKKKK